jgi:Transposase IS4
MVRHRIGDRGRLSLISSIEELVATLSKEGKRLLYTLRSQRHFGYSYATSYGGHSRVYSPLLFQRPDSLGNTYKIPNKLIKQNYKIFALANNSYIWHFQLSLRQHRIKELEKVDKLTLTSLMVLQIAQLLSKFLNSYFVIYMDNYFMLILLFLMLRKENISIASVTA